MLKSKKRLFADLAALLPDAFSEAPVKGLEHPRIDDETYGKKSFIYIAFRSCEERQVMEEALRCWGWNPDRRYSPGSGRAEVQVSYFKGQRWWE